MCWFRKFRSALEIAIISQRPPYELTNSEHNGAQRHNPQRRCEAENQQEKPSESFFRYCLCEPRRNVVLEGRAQLRCRWHPWMAKKRIATVKTVRWVRKNPGVTYKEWCARRLRGSRLKKCRGASQRAKKAGSSRKEFNRCDTESKTSSTISARSPIHRAIFSRKMRLLIRASRRTTT